MMIIKNKKHLRTLDDNQIQSALLREFLSKGLVKAAVMSIDEHVRLIDKQKGLLIDIKSEIEDRNESLTA